MAAGSDQLRAEDEAVSAKRLTQELLAAMGILRVVNVDDEHFRSPEQDLDVVVAGLRSNAIELVLVARILLNDEDDPTAGDLEADEVIDLLREKWIDLADDRRIDLTHAARQAEAANQGTVDTQSESLLGNNAALLALPELLGESNITFTTMSFGEWRDSGQALLSDGVPTLLLFDRSFAGEGQSETAGEELVRGVLQNADFAHVKVGLLTHTATDIGNEQEIARLIASGLGDNPRPVVVVAKSRLKSDDTAFPEALRMVLFAEELEAFRLHAIEALRASSKAEVDLLASVDQYALMATFESARKEGLFETDNVTRMARAPGVRELTARFRDEGFIVSTLSKLRNAAAVQLYFSGAERPVELPALVWQERFDPKEHLEGLSLPLEVGDIFRVFDLLGSGKDRYYVLLTQQCDLSVRHRGERANDSGTFILTRLVEASWDSKKNQYSPPKGHQANIGQFFDGSEAPWYLNFALRLHVPSLALDACVVHPSGRSVIGPETAAPHTLSASWEKRIVILRKSAKTIIDKMALAHSALTITKGQEVPGNRAMENLGAALAGGVVQGSSALTARVNVEDRTVEYGIERISRVVGTAAIGLFALAAQHQARPAFDNELFFDPTAEVES